VFEPSCRRSPRHLTPWTRETGPTRNGYSARALAELLNARPAELRAFLHGQLAPGRTQGLHAQLLAAGLPV
jgi:hypothetical protein